jgi:hypothetical protein
MEELRFSEKYVIIIRLKGITLQKTAIFQQHMLVVPLLRRLVSGLSQLSFMFKPGTFHVGFVVEKLTLRQGFL